MQLPEITVGLVAQLIADQFPNFTELPIQPIETGGWDNRIFHLGDDYCVRLPSAPDYAAQVEKEQRFLPILSSKLPNYIPRPVAKGQPSDAFPLSWSIYHWMPGDTAFKARPDLKRLAKDLGRFLKALQAIRPDESVLFGAHSAYRGGPIHIWNDQFFEALTRLDNRIDGHAAQRIWDEANDSPPVKTNVWVHGDVTAGNLLIVDGTLYAVIDFGLLNVGDPACDMAIAWTFLDQESRPIFRDAVGCDDGIWARGKAWALWKAMIIEAGLVESNAVEMALAPRVLSELGIAQTA